MRHLPVFQPAAENGMSARRETPGPMERRPHRPKSDAMNAPTAFDDRLETAYALVDDHVRRFDKDRWLSALYAPEDKRCHLLALYAFSIEIARIRDLVSDPLPGEIRARWWADTLAGSRCGEGEAHPIAAALLDTVARFRLPLDEFDRLIEARIFDLYDDPMSDVAALEAYCRDTAATLIRLAARVLADGRDPSVAEIADHAGTAHGLTLVLRALPHHAAHGRVLLPETLLAAHGLDRATVLGGRSSPALAAALAEIRGRAREELAATRRMIRAIPPEVAPAFLPVSLVEMCLDRMDRRGYDPFRTPVESPQWRRQLRLWRAARRARRAAARFWHHV